jgi:hypothetical protein
MPKEYVAYIGQEFTIEWYYSPSGESQALHYYQELDTSDRIKVLKLFKLMGDIGKISDQTKFRNEGDKIYAFKPQPHRFLSFFVEGKKVIITKKQDKLPQGEKDRAVNSMNLYRQRIKEGTYYEKEK